MEREEEEEEGRGVAVSYLSGSQTKVGNKLRSELTEK